MKPTHVLLLHTQAELFCFIDKVHACTIYAQSIGSLLLVSLHTILKAKTSLLTLVQLSLGLGCRLFQSLFTFHIYTALVLPRETH